MASFPQNRYVLASEEAVDRRRPSISSTLLCYSSILRTPQTMLPKTLRNAVEWSKPRTFYRGWRIFPHHHRALLLLLLFRWISSMSLRPRVSPIRLWRPLKADMYYHSHRLKCSATTTCIYIP